MPCLAPEPPQSPAQHTSHQFARVQTGKPMLCRAVCSAGPTRPVGANLIGRSQTGTLQKHRLHDGPYNDQLRPAVHHAQSTRDRFVLIRSIIVSAPDRSTRSCLLVSQPWRNSRSNVRASLLLGHENRANSARLLGTSLLERSSRSQLQAHTGAELCYYSIRWVSAVNQSAALSFRCGVCRSFRDWLCRGWLAEQAAVARLPIVVVEQFVELGPRLHLR
jgi:hypothetical protein